MSSTEIQRFALKKKYEAERALASPEIRTGPTMGALPPPSFRPKLMTTPLLPESEASERYVKERRTIVSVNSVHRQEFEQTVLERNSETGLYTREVEADDGSIIVEEYTAAILNSEHEPSPTSPPNPYSTASNGDIIQLKYKYQDPGYYVAELPRTFYNVKNLGIQKCVVPNTNSIINPENNLIMLDIQDEDVELTDAEIAAGLSQSLPLVAEAPYSYQIVALTPGNYTLIELASHLQTQLNTSTQTQTVEGLSDLFEVTADETSGEFTIELNDPSGRNLTFFLKFLDTVGGDFTREESNMSLWYRLGFQTAAESNSDGSNLYSKSRTNLFDFGASTLDSSETVLQPYRQPNLQAVRFIYLRIHGFESIVETNTSSAVYSPIPGALAQVHLDVAPGEYAYDTHSITPMIFFRTPLPRLNELKIEWLDEHGHRINFRHLDHSLLVEIIEYTDALASVEYSTRRGAVDQSETSTMSKAYN